MYGCESWNIKKAEHQRIATFKLWSWRGLLRASWTARRSNQSILKEINCKYSWEGLALKLLYLVTWWWTEKSSGIQSEGQQRVGCDWVTKHTYTHVYMNHFAGHLKLTQHRKSNALQFLKCPEEISFLRNNMRGPGRIQSKHLAVRFRRRRAPKWSS